MSNVQVDASQLYALLDQVTELLTICVKLNEAHEEVVNYDRQKDTCTSINRVPK